MATLRTFAAQHAAEDAAHRLAGCSIGGGASSQREFAGR
jgi:hypothetical protein